MKLRHAIGDGRPLLIHRVEHAHRQMNSDAGLVGGNPHDGPAINLPDFAGRFPGGPGHTAEDRILAEKALKAHAGQVFFVGGDLDVFFHFDRLVQTMPPRSIGHHAAGEFVDDGNFALVIDEILLIANKAMPRGERLRHQFFAAALAAPETIAAGKLFEAFLAGWS